MQERSWKAFRSQQDKYKRLPQSDDFRRKKGLIARLTDFLRGILGR